MKKYNWFAWTLLILGCLVLFVEIICFSHLTSLVWTPSKFDANAVQITSSIGSMIGGTVGVIFSLASVIFFILALKSQQEESKIIRTQADLQALEISVFNLFVIQNDIRKSIFDRDNLIGIAHYEIDRPQTLSSLRNTDMSFEDFFKAFKEDSKFLLGKDTNGIVQYFGTYVVYKDQYNWDSPDKMLENYYQIDPQKLSSNGKKEVYNRFLGEFRSVIGHYFRNLYHILKYLFDKEQEEQKNRKDSKEVYLKYKKYADLLQAQMSTYELLLCFYNGLIFKRAKFLYQYYDLLENINLEEMIDESDNEFYSEPMIQDGITANPIIFKSRSEW